MKKWEAPVVNELNLSETAYKVLGNACDGGYVGDGILSGHLEWECPDKEQETEPETNPSGNTNVDLLS